MSAEVLRTGALCAFALLVVIAAVRDTISYTIPNWINGLLALAFAPAALACGVKPIVIAEAAGLGVAMLAVGIGMFAMGWLGGGDAKLLAAATPWLGLSGIFPFVVYTGLFGGLLAVGLLGLRSAWLRPAAMNGPAWVCRLATPGAATPYGVAIAAGALAAFPAGLLMHAANGSL